MVFSYKLDNYWGGTDDYATKPKKKKLWPEKKALRAVNLFLHFAWLIFGMCARLNGNGLLKCHGSFEANC